MEGTKKCLTILGFTPKEGSSDILSKKYSNQNDYEILIKLDSNKENSSINWGDKIQVKRSTTSNLGQEETLVVLECVNRLLEKGYKPEDIILEDSWKLGHKGKGFLDISVKKGGQTFLMIECKTWGKEYEKELRNLYKDGGQLFSYFQQDKSAEYLILYTSKLEHEQIEYKNDIVVIEQSYRETNNLGDLFERWNKFTSNNGIFEDWISAYHYENRSLTKKDLKPLTEEDSSFIFHEFSSILRRHAVSDKPNAFNKIFNLFLAKIFDEKKRDIDELEFQWREGHPDEDEVEFEVRLINLYKGGMDEFLKKEVDGISDEMFRSTDPQELKENKRKVLRLDSVFKIKEVHDEETFMDNFRVLKDVVLLLQKYQIRYPRKQRHLSDFFELLLTTGLKQESGQFFTPPAVAKFMVKSVPFQQKIKEKLEIGNTSDLLPNIVDYACGSGHFLTESMEETQHIIDNLELDSLNLYPQVEEEVEVWQKKKYDWAKYHVYGIEKDNRLVKVAKVGCYFYGDGLAQVIHGDGLDSFADSKTYRGLLKQNSLNKNPDHPKFDFILANPPYSVDNFKLDLKNKNENDFELYKYLTDNSSEIEVLFIERTKQLLKDGAIATIILPSSILSNSGLYTKAREILLRNFEFVAISEFGSNTFMATGTNTVILFLKKRENAETLVTDIKTYIQKAFETKQDLTINGVEKMLSKYLKNSPPEGLKPQTDGAVLGYFEYLETNFTKEQIDLEKEKILYFALAYTQKVALIKSGQKDEEKKFLGYYFSNRRGHEGIKPFVAGGSIDDCTYLYDEKDLWNPKVASSYIQKAFAGKLENIEIDEELKDHVFKVDLVDLIDFESKKFEKIINTRAKKKLKIESKWEVVKLGSFKNVDFISGFAFKSENLTNDKKENYYPVLKIGNVKMDNSIDLENVQYHEFNSSAEKVLLQKNDILVALTGATVGKVGLLNQDGFLLNQRVLAIRVKDEILRNYIYIQLRDKFYEYAQDIAAGSARDNLSPTQTQDFQIPLPPLNIQTQIVAEIEKIETEGQKAKAEIEELKNQISELVENAGGKEVRLVELAEIIAGQSPKSEFYNHVQKGLPFYQGKIEFTENYLSEPRIWTTQTTKESIKNDILMSVRAPVGDVNLNPFEKICIGRGLCAIRIKDENTRHYVWTVLKARKENIKEVAKQGASFEAITKSNVEEIKIPLPPLKTQQKIVAQILEIEQKIEKLKNQLAETPKQKEAVLKKYL